MPDMSTAKFEMNNMTPQEAFEKFKALYPAIVAIERMVINTQVCLVYAIGVRDSVPNPGIQWGSEGSYKPETWRPAKWPRDAADPPKKCRVRDADSDWKSTVLCGYNPGLPFSWMTSSVPYQFWRGP